MISASDLLSSSEPLIRKNRLRGSSLVTSPDLYLTLRRMTPRAGAVCKWAVNASVNRPHPKSVKTNALRIDFRMLRPLAGGSPPLNGEEFTLMFRGGLRPALGPPKSECAGDSQTGE